MWIGVPFSPANVRLGVGSSLSHFTLKFNTNRPGTLLRVYTLRRYLLYIIVLSTSTLYLELRNRSLFSCPKPRGSSTMMHVAIGVPVVSTIVLLVISITPQLDLFAVHALLGYVVNRAEFNTCPRIYLHYTRTPKCLYHCFLGESCIAVPTDFCSTPAAQCATLFFSPKKPFEIHLSFTVP